MPGAVIVASQSGGAGAGSPGVARNDLWLDKSINFSVGSTGNTTFLWTLLSRPPGSVASFDTPTLATANLVPDKNGTYRVKLETNGGGTGNSQIRVYRVRFDENGALAERGWALPAFEEEVAESNYGSNTRGWAEVVEYILEDVRTTLDELEAGGGGGGSNPSFADDSIAGWDVANEEWVPLEAITPASGTDSFYAVFQRLSFAGVPKPMGLPLGNTYASFAAVVGTIPTVVDIQDGNPVGYRDGVLVVCQIDGDPTDQNIVANHKRYNWAGGFEVGRIGQTIVHSFAALAASLVVDLPWDNARAGVLEVRASFTQSASTLRISRTYKVRKTSGGALTVTEDSGGPSNQFDPIAGANITLAAAGSTLRLTIANATSGATNVVASIEGERVVIP